MAKPHTLKTLSLGFIALGALGFVIFCGFQIPDLSTAYSVKDLVPKQHPLLKEEHEQAEQFALSTDASILAMLEIPESQSSARASSWTNADRMASLARLTETIGQLRNVKSAVSIANVDIAESGANEMRIGPLMEAVPAERWNETLKHQPLLQPQLISSDHRSALIVIHPASFLTKDLEDLDRDIQKEIKSSDGSYIPGLTGVPIIQTRLSDKIQNELGRFLILSLLVFVAMFALFYRNISPLALVAVSIVTCNVCAIGVISYLHIPFNALLGTLPIIVSVACVSLQIHTFHLWADRLKELGPQSDLTARRDLLFRVLKEIFIANLLGSLTTAIGFLALATTPIPAIKTYALVVAGTVMLAFVMTQILFLVFLPFVCPAQRDWTNRRATWMLAITNHARLSLAAVLSLSAVMLYFAFSLNLSSRLFDDLPARDTVSLDMKRVDHFFGGTVDLSIAVELKAQDWSQPANLKELAAALAEIRAVHGVGSALGLTDFFGQPTPATNDKVAEAYFLYSMAQANPLRNFVNGNRQTTRLALRLSDLSSDQVADLRGNVRTILKRHFPAAGLIETGLAVHSHLINSEVSRELVFGFWQSVAAIGLLLIFVFRSVRLAAVACLPNLLAPILLMGTMALVGTPIKPAVALIFSVAIGLAFNNTVYLLSTLRRNRERIENADEALEQTLLDEGPPVSFGIIASRRWLFGFR